MKNIIRKALREIIDQLGQLEKETQYKTEKIWIESARVSLVRADYYEFHINPQKKYKEPKTNFKYNEYKHL